MPNNRLKSIVKELAKNSQSEENSEIINELEQLWSEQYTLTTNNQEIFHSIVDNVIDGIITINKKGIIQTFNKAAEKLFMYDSLEVIGKNINMLMPEPYKSEHDSYLKNYMESGREKIIGIGREVEGLRKDASTFPLDLSISKINLGEEVIFAGIIRDISEIRFHQEELQQSQDRLQSIVDNVYEGIITIDAKGSIDSFNLAAEKIFGYKQDEVLSKNVKMLMPEPYHSEHDGYLSNYMNTGKEKIIGIGREVRGRKKNGIIFPLFLAVTHTNNHGKPLFVGMVKDLTEQKRLEKLKNEFISTISHELRTPLTSIRGSLSLIDAGVVGTVDEKVSSLIQIALSNSERLILLINDILDIEKIESGEMSFDLEKVDLNKLISDSIELNQGFAREHNVLLNQENNKDKVLVYVDKNRLQQVITNLISNAVKYSPKGDIVLISTIINNRQVRLQVHDKGSGIPQSFKKRIFQKFAQADSSDTKQKGGTGLGLNISRSIIEKFGGTIGFESSSEAGTTFFFDLPMANSPKVKLTKQSSEHRILIVEDDYDIAIFLSMIIQKENITCDIAYNAQEAKKMLSENKYNIMTLDIGLPDQDGIELLEELRKDVTFKNLSVIVISAKTSQDKKVKNSYDLEIVDWINKPINKDLLIESLHTIISKKENYKARILHVEDDLDIANLVNILLKDLGKVDLSVNKKEALFQLGKDIPYDLILLDMLLPDGSAEELLPYIKKYYPSTPIVLFSAQEVNNTLKEQVSKALVKSRTNNNILVETIKNILKK
jgi:PAS domain S-box-containing protein